MLFTKRNQSGYISLQGKVVYREEYEEYLKMRDLLHSAKQDIDQSRQRLMEDWNSKREGMFKDMCDKIQSMYTEKMFSATLLILKYLSSQEQKIADIVIGGLEETLSRLDAKKVMQEVITQALNVMRDQSKLTLRVHKDQLSMARSMVRTILKEYPGVQVMEVVADDEVKVNTCILDGGMGSVHSDLQSQISYIKNALTKIMG